MKNGGANLEQGFFRMSWVELYTKLVFFGWYRSEFLGIYHTDTKGKLGQYQNVGGNPFFPQKGGNGPLFS
jgi:hypothetical protein